MFFEGLGFDVAVAGDVEDGFEEGGAPDGPTGIGDEVVE